MFGKFFLILTLLLNFFWPTAQAQVWQAPPGNPPTGNRPQPVDVSATTQTKTGGLNIQGNLGVGTVNPQTNLEINDASPIATTLRITDTAQNPELQLQYGSIGNDHWSLYVNNTSNHLIIWNGSDRLAIDSAGNVGINTVSPNKRLEIADNELTVNVPTVRITNTADYGGYSVPLNEPHGALEFYSTYTGGNYPAVTAAIKAMNESNAGNEHGLGFFVNNNSVNPSEVMRINENGTVGINVVSPNDAYKLDVNGSVNSSGGYCIGGNCVTQWSDVEGDTLWNDQTTYIEAANIAGTSGLEIYDAEYGGVKLVNNNLQLHNNSLIYQTTDAGSSPVLIDDQLMVGRRYSNPDCGHYCDLGVDMLNGENLIFGRVRQTTIGNDDATQNLLRLQRGDGSDAQIDKLVVDLDGNANLAGTLAVGSNSDPYSNLAIWTNKDAADGSSLDDFALLIQNPADDNFEEVGIGFRISNTHNNSSYPGAAITFERTGNNSQGKLRFKTFNDVGNDFSTRMVINQLGNVSIGFTNPNLEPSYKLEVEGDIRAKEKSDGSLGNLRADNDLIIGGTGSFGGNVLFGDGYGDNGITLENNGNGWFNGLLIVDSAFYVGGGYGQTGLTVDSAGNFGTNGMSQFGSNSLNVTSVQNLIYGNIDDSSVGNLLLLQKEGVDKLKVDSNGNLYLGNLYLPAEVNMYSNNLRFLYSKNRNVTVGLQAGDDLVDNAPNNALNNALIGSRAGYKITSGDNNTAVGSDAMMDNATTAYNNAVLGYQAGYNLEGNNNTLIGYKAGDNLTTGAGNIVIGASVDVLVPTGSNQLNIGNTIYGDLANDRVGIGVSSPSSPLEVNGYVEAEGVKNNNGTPMIRSVDGNVVIRLGQ